MPRCSFSAKEIPKGKGMMYVKKDGTVYYFYDSKCRNNFLKLKREGRRQKWTPAYRDFQALQSRKVEAAAGETGKAKPAAKPAKK